MNSNKNRAVLFVGLLLLVATSLISLGIGALSLPIKEVIYALLSSIFDNINITTQTQSVVINVRLPRILTALICGAGLAAAGAAAHAAGGGQRRTLHNAAENMVGGEGAGESVCLRGRFADPCS